MFLKAISQSLKCTTSTGHQCPLSFWMHWPLTSPNHKRCILEKAGMCHRQKLWYSRIQNYFLTMKDHVWCWYDIIHFLELWAFWQYTIHTHTKSDTMKERKIFCIHLNMNFLRMLLILLLTSKLNATPIPPTSNLHLLPFFLPKSCRHSFKYTKILHAATLHT